MKKITLFLTGFVISTGVFSQIIPESDPNTSTVITCSDFHISRPLSELSKETPYVPKKHKEIKLSGDRGHRTPQKFIYSVENGEIYGEDPSVRQTEMGERNLSSKAPIKNWPGQPGDGSRPLDPSGAAGPNHYVQAINASPFRVFNKSTGATLLTANIGTLWSPDTGNEGDPIVLYDKYADRWLISQFGSPNKIYIAISTTPDPTGSYYTYSFNSAQFPDYLKFSIWADGYYMTSNQTPQRVYCFERDQMLVGNASSRAVTSTFSTGATSGFYCPLSADADGGLPAVGTPCPFFAYSENAWGGGAIDGVKIWNMSVTWGATPTASIVLNTTVPTAAFDASYDSGWNDVSQPGTSDKLDGIGGVPTYRAQWRSWNGYNTMLLNWGVKISNTQRSIRWVELRQNQTSGVWSLYQEGTYAPDSHTRWIGSIAMDDNGSIGLAYDKSSSTVYPSLCYTGRVATDPLGTMTFTETVAAAGATSENYNRYGDYSQLSLDPDGITFWHTGEYTPAGGTTTRVYSFQLPSIPYAVVAVASDDSDYSICAGQSITFTATPTNGGTAPVYQWQVDGSNVGTDSPTFTTSSLIAGQSITCIMTSNLPGAVGSPYTSTPIVITNNTDPTVSISGDNTICLGQSTTFTATPVNAGTSPSYQWQVDGANVGADSPTFSSSSLINGNSITCSYSSTCNSTTTVNSSPVVISINPSPTLSVSGDNTICAGSSTTFLASVTNFGTSSSYQWQVNGSNVGLNSTTFSSSSLTNESVVTCLYTSTCGFETTVNSSPITMIVTPLPATPTITQNGLVLTSSSSTGNQWYLNGMIINGATNQTYTALQNGNYTVKVTSNGCTSVISAISLMNSVGINEVVNIGTHFYIYPNPSNGIFSLVFTSTEIMEYTVRLHNALGQIIYEEKIDKFNGTYTKDFDVTNYGKGQYFLTMTNEKNQKLEKVIVF